MLTKEIKTILSNFKKSMHFICNGVLESCASYPILTYYPLGPITQKLSNAMFYTHVNLGRAIKSALTIGVTYPKNITKCTILLTYLAVRGYERDWRCGAQGGSSNTCSTIGKWPTSPSINSDGRPLIRWPTKPLT